MVSVNLETLREHLIKIELINVSYQLCIDWAVSELLRGVENEEICILASLNINNIDEIKTYLRKILGEHMVFNEDELEEAAGKIILESGRQYLNDEIDIITIESIIDKLYVKLNYTDWLVMLARNSEYATDINSFVQPFENELTYIMDLWTQFPKYEEFKQHYNRDVSNLNT